MQKSGNKLKANQPLRVLLKFFLGKYLSWAYVFKGENLEILNEISPPYLVLPNHMSFWDPFFINCFIPSSIHYVVSDAHFRFPLKRFFLSLVGAFPKTKFVSDYETVKNIFRVKKDNGIIGIFPEGRRTWDGHTQPLLYSTAKLIKKLKIPVIIPIVKGAFLSLPRWTKKKRKGNITISFKNGFSPEEITSMKTDEIYQKMNQLLAYDEYNFQKKKMIPFPGKRRAEFMELTLFICPQCHSIATLHSHKNNFYCKQCNYTVFYNQYGFLEKKSKIFYFNTIRGWNIWQLDYLKDLFKEQKKQGSQKLIFSDSRIWLLTGYKRNPHKRFRFGHMSLFLDRIEFHTLKHDRLIFKLADIHGINVQDNEKLEFYFDNTLYRCNFLNRRTSSFKWMKAVNILKETDTESG